MLLSAGHDRFPITGSYSRNRDKKDLSNIEIESFHKFYFIPSTIVHTIYNLWIRCDIWLKK